MLIERVAFEEEQARIAAEREELEQLRKAEAARRAEQARIEAEARKALEAEEARQRAERKAMEQQRAELDAQQRRIEEQARIEAELDAQQRRIEEEKRQLEAANVKAKRGKGKAPVDPLADLKRALAAGEIVANVALDQAYALGFNAGLQSAPGGSPNQSHGRRYRASTETQCTTQPDLPIRMRASSIIWMMK